MLCIFHRTFTFYAINNVMNAVTGISPIIGIISACFFTGMILMVFAFAIHTGDPVTKLIILRIGRTAKAFILIMRTEIEC